jgi:hypothetical protein
MWSRIGVRASSVAIAGALLIYGGEFPLAVETQATPTAQQPAQAPQGQPGQAGQQTQNQDAGRGGRADAVRVGLAQRTRPTPTQTSASNLPSFLFLPQNNRNTSSFSLAIALRRC